MEPTRKPLAVLITLVALGLPLDALTGNSDWQLSSAQQRQHMSSGRAASTARPFDISSEVNAIGREVVRIQQHNVLLKQRVIVLEARLASVLHKYRRKERELAVAEQAYRARLHTAERTGKLMPVALLPNPPKIAPIETTLIVPIAMSTDESIASNTVEAADQAANDNEVATPRAVAAEVVDASAGSVQEEISDVPVVGDLLAMNDATLGEIRGGFTTTSGLQISFGIERALYIDGALIATTSLNVSDASKLTPVTPTLPDLSKLPTAEQLAGAVNVPTADQLAGAVKVPAVSTTVTGSSAVAVPSTGASAAVTTSGSAATGGEAAAAVTPPVASAATASSQGNPVAMNSPLPATGSSAPAVSGPAVPEAATTSLALIQSGAGNAVQAGTIATSSIGTVVQNTLNNQKIQNVTVINATVNSMEILKTLNLQSAIGNAVAESLRK